MKRLTVTFFIVFLFLITGCTRAPWVIKSTPPTRTISSEYYDITITPIGYRDGSGFYGFDLKITNKTNEDFELIWDKTYYLLHGQTSGGFYFGGIFYREVNEHKQNDIIFSKQTFQNLISPSCLVYFYRGWSRKVFPNGENGIYLTMLINGKEIREKLTVDIFLGYDESQRYTTVWGKMLQIN